ncbi:MULTISPECIES: carboxylate/amino acid/amine transporter [unclassified Pseudomonas]|uniref:carboxylate/amino acid/amine transporter n=1 Tax=unclassified Pseudomonas TaxID=196821 RepID=UPI0024480D87|nr:MULTISPECIES: carboxylate/amino acid/amine transporter [unclassified Pseudomonas]MDG9923453.1 carboxylate/amino acid/amine transporter [Pseudomonas sp. GD04045]MDH0035423.1 carboxylate/amino acid/amine transporter [Pseudomonas sp. GD04019]
MPYLLIVTALWAFSFSLIGEYLAGRVDSDFAVLARVLIAALVFLPFTLWRGLPWRLLAGFWLAGALQFGVTYLCLYRSFQVLTVPEVLLFTVLTPIYVTLLDDALARRFSPWALLAALVAVGGGVIIRFDKLEGDYLLGFILLQIANATFAGGQVLCRRLLLHYQPTQPLHRFFGHFFLGALVLVLPSFLLFGDPQKLPQTTVQWGVLIWMGLFATALGLYWWVKGSTRVDAGTLAIMNELHVPAGLLVNLLIWNRDFDLPRLVAGGAVILVAMALLRLGRRRAPALA